MGELSAINRQLSAYLTPRIIPVRLRNTPERSETVHLIRRSRSSQSEKQDRWYGTGQTD
jgi:hypothetical protein